MLVAGVRLAGRDRDRDRGDRDDLSPDAVATLAANDEAFDFLKDPREDVYGESDGEAV